MAVEVTKAIRVFYSYAHEDKKLRDDLDKHLGALKRSGLIVTWYDRDIQAGTQWEDEIDTRLATSDLILLLISNDFIDSDYCYGREMQLALERHNAESAHVIPIILRPVDWEGTPFSKLQVLPADGKPITDSRNRDAAFLKVVRGIRDVVTTLLNQQKKAYLTIQKQQTINTHEAVRLFRQLMKTDNYFQPHVFYLTGNAKMGKSHLLTKVFPILAQHEYQAWCIFFDLRNRIYSVSDILNTACEQLGQKNCGNYYKAYQEIVGNTTSALNVTSILTNFSSFSTFTDINKDAQKRDDRLTTQLVLDFSKLSDKPLVLFFDSVDNATEQIQKWLLQTFLGKLWSMSHVRVVVAGRTLPDAPSDYVDLLQVHQLHAVREEEEYVAYCKTLNITAVEHSLIRSIARDCDYTPGLFVDYLSTKVIS